MCLRADLDCVETAGSVCNDCVMTTTVSVCVRERRREYMCEFWFHLLAIIGVANAYGKMFMIDHRENIDQLFCRQ